MVAEKSDCTHHCPYIPMTNVSESTRFNRGGPAERLTEVPRLELLAESHDVWLTMLRLRRRRDDCGVMPGLRTAVGCRSLRLRARC